MKKSALFGGLLLVSLVIAFGWLVVGVQAFTIKQVVCTWQDTSCPDPITQELTTALVGKSLFTTDFDQVVALDSFRVEAFSKQLPGQLTVSVTPQQKVLLAEAVLIAPSDPTELTAQLTTFFAEAELSFQHIEPQPENNLVVVTFGPEQALLRYDHAEADAHKVVLIKKHLRLAEIDTGIVEIDARYQMPVLRTTKSF